MVVVSLGMFLNSTQDTFVKYRNDKICLVKGNINSGKTISAIFKTLYLKRNYCFDIKDKILFLTSESEVEKVSDIFNYINRSDLYMSIIPSEDIEVHILTYRQFLEYKMDCYYTHVFIDGVEDFCVDGIKHVFSFFRNISYSKFYLIQNSTENIERVSQLLEHLRKSIQSREGVFNFRYVIDYNDRDEFTQISMTPDIKYLDYVYREYVDFDTRSSKGYYLKNDRLYVDRGTFLYDITHESLRIELMNGSLICGDYVSILNSWVNCGASFLRFVEISDEGMGSYDLFRGDIVLINTLCDINDNDVVVILKCGYMYARKISENGKITKFVCDESIFSDIHLDESVKILGKVVGYIR